MPPANYRSKTYPMEALGIIDFTKYALSTIINLMQSSENGQVKNPVSLTKKKKNHHQTSLCTSSIYLSHICIVLKISNESSKRSGFHKICTINHYLLGAVIIKKWPSQKPCKFVKKYFFSIKLLHAHLQYICNIYAKC